MSRASHMGLCVHGIRVRMQYTSVVEQCVGRKKRRHDAISNAARRHVATARAHASGVAHDVPRVHARARSMSPVTPLRRGDDATAMAAAKRSIDDALATAAADATAATVASNASAETGETAETKPPSGLARSLNATRGTMVVGSPSNGMSGLIKDALRLVEKTTKEGGKRVEIARVEEQLSFDKGFYLTIRAIQLLKMGMPDRTIVVGVAGPSGAGKTVFTSKIQEFMPGAVTLSMDMYNDASMLLEGNFDDPRLTDYSCLLDNLRGLKNGEAVQVPVYDFKESKRTGYVTVPNPTAKVVILEGIYALNEKLRPMIDLRVSVTGGVHFDLVKRVLRDINRSGQAPESIIHQISETVYPMYKAFIEPDLRTAHLKVVNSFNPFQGFQDPVYILKSDRVPEEKLIKAVLGNDCQITEEVETADIYLLPPNEDPETCTSWLRMRNRDGHYTLMFAETVTDGPIMISPRIKFEVGVRILGGLMALGYVVGAIMKRRSKEYSDDLLTIKTDWVEGLDRSFVQVQGRLCSAVEAAGRKLGLEGTYIPHSYIEQVQLEKLTQELTSLTDDLKTRFPITESMLTSATDFSGDSDDGVSPDDHARTRRSPGGSDSGSKLPPHPPRPKSAAPANWGGYGLDDPADGAYYATPPPRSQSRGPSRHGRPYETSDRGMTSPGRRTRTKSPSGKRTSPTGTGSRDLELKFDWLATRVEKLGELQRAASAEIASDYVATPGGSRVKESEVLARELQNVNAKLDAMALSVQRQQLDVARLEMRQALGAVAVGTLVVAAAFVAGASGRR